MIFRTEQACFLSGTRLAVRDTLIVIHYDKEPRASPNLGVGEDGTLTVLGKVPSKPLFAAE
jgi:hypothetical protein